MGETLRLRAADGHEFGAYRAPPAGTPKAGLVVIQEIFGVNAHIRDVCDGYAEAGYLAVAPAVYDRVERDVELAYTDEDRDRGREIRARCDMDHVIRDVACAAETASAAGGVGIVGYCWGGLVAYVAACRLGDKLACVSGYYGGNIRSNLSEKPAVPLILHFGSADASIPLGDVDRIRAALPQVAVHVYQGAEHGFNCDRRQQYLAAAAALARERTLAFFSEHLG